MAEPVVPGQSKTNNHEASPPPAKKPRITPDPPLFKARITPEPIKSNNRRRPIPPLLSPTLHPNIEEELARLKANAIAATEQAAPAMKSSRNDAKLASKETSSKETSSVSSRASNSSVSKNTVSSSTPKASNSLRETLHPKPRNSLADQTDKTVKTNGVVASAKPLTNGLGGKNKEETLESVGPKSVAEQFEDKSLIVKLKIPKSARKNLARIISLRQGPKKPERILAPENPTVRSSPTRDHHESKTASNQYESDVSKTGEKRRRRAEEHDEVEPSNKRQRPAAGAAAGGVPKTHTPARTLLRSPAASGVAHKPHTPSRSVMRSPASSQQDGKASAMRRIASTEGNVQTPSGGTRIGTPTAPFSAERATRDARAGLSATPSTVAPVQSAECTALKAEQKKYFDLGRSRKHDADVFLNRESKHYHNEDPVAKNQGIALAIETVLCYMLAFCLSDEISRISRKPGSENILAWRSLTGYLHFIIGVVEPTPHLHGLCCHLEAVCRETIHAYELDRLDHDPLPSTDFSPPTDPDVAAKAKSYRRDYADFKLKFVENARAALQAWLKGNWRLPCDELQQSYPKTWGKRAKAPCDTKGKEKLVAGKYNGGFYLPLGSTTSGIEAVRMGWSFLDEWCSKDGVKWEGKMAL